MKSSKLTPSPSSKRRHRNSSLLNRFRLRNSPQKLVEDNYENDLLQTKPRSMKSTASSKSSPNKVKGAMVDSPAATGAEGSNKGLKRFMKIGKKYESLDNFENGSSRERQNSKSNLSLSSSSSSRKADTTHTIENQDTSRVLREVIINQRTSKDVESSDIVSKKSTGIKLKKKRKSLDSPIGKDDTNSLKDNVDSQYGSFGNHHSLDNKDHRKIANRHEYRSHSESPDDDESDEGGSLLKRYRETNYTGKSSSKTNVPSYISSDAIETFESLEIASALGSEASFSPNFSPSSIDTGGGYSLYFDDDDEADYADGIPIDFDSNEESDDNDNDDDDDDLSCDSTVVNDKPPRIVRPPPTATKAEEAKFYWDLCYGNEKEKIALPPLNSWSVKRKPPAKSCLSSKKTPWTEIALSHKKRMKKGEKGSIQDQYHTPVGPDQFEQFKKITAHPSPMKGDGVIFNNHKSPIMKTPQGCQSRSTRRIKFGISSAAEFESTRPTVELTPLPSEKVRERFPVDEKDVSSDDDSVQMHHETARNGARLAMWDDDFDSYVDEWDENDSDVDDDSDDCEDSFRTGINMSRRSSESRRKSVNSRRGDRRSSIFFSREGGSLVKSNNNDDSSREKRNPNGDDDDIMIGNHQQILSPDCRDDMHFSSPSTACASYRLSTSESETSKVTPKSDVNSSSSLLRSVHSEGGASMGRNHDDTTQELKPSQLDITLRKAEKDQFSKKNIAVLRSSIINRMINEAQDVEEGITSISDHNIGSLLCELTHYYGCMHDITISSFFNNAMNISRAQSLIDISEDIDETISMNSINTDNIGRNDVIELLNMSVSLLEQQTPTEEEIDERMLRIISESFFQRNDSVVIYNLYSTISEIAFMQWNQLEMQALQTMSSWFQPVHQANCEEEVSILMLMQKCQYCGSSRKCRNKREILAETKRRVIYENEAINAIESAIQKEEEELIKLSYLGSHWSSKVEVDMHAPLAVIDHTLLKFLLEFSSKTLSLDQFEVTYPHLGGVNSATQVTLSLGIQDDPTDERRVSMTSIDSGLSSNRKITLVSRTPEMKRLTASAHNGPTNNESRLPAGSAAYKLYSIMLDSEYLNKFILSCFNQDVEAAILTATDIFQRLNLLARDVMELHKYYSCRVENPSKTSTVVLHVTISLGVSLSIGIRFTYDLSNEKTILYSIPSDIFILPITGEPSVPINLLLRVAKHTVWSEPILNAFVLKRTCTTIVDTLQGRTCDMH